MFVVDQLDKEWAIKIQPGVDVVPDRLMFLDVGVDGLGLSVPLGAFGPGTFDERGLLGLASSTPSIARTATGREAPAKSIDGPRSDCPGEAPDQPNPCEIQTGWFSSLISARPASHQSRPEPAI